MPEGGKRKGENQLLATKKIEGKKPNG